MINKILIIEDDLGLQKYLKELLLNNQYIVQLASTGVSGLNSINKLPPDLAILDLGLPDLRGESVVKEVRKKHPNLPVIILTAKDAISDIIDGLNQGADDYITKPFVADVLLARIKARLRRTCGSVAKLRVDDLELDDKTMETKRGNKVIHLTPQEFKLLEYLMRNKGNILTRDMILNRVWLYSQDIETRVVDVYMGYLRKKIDNNHKKKLLRSVRGFGYMIKD